MTDLDFCTGVIIERDRMAAVLATPKSEGETAAKGPLTAGLR